MAVYTYGGKTIDFNSVDELALAIQKANMPRLKAVAEKIARDALEDEVYNRTPSENYERTFELQNALKVKEDPSEECGVLIYIDGSEFSSVDANRQNNAHHQYFEPSPNTERLIEAMDYVQDEDVMGAVKSHIEANFKKEFMYGKSY